MANYKESNWNSQNLRSLLVSLAFVLTSSVVPANAQTIRFDGYYEANGQESASYMRFYADGVALAVTYSRPISKDSVMFLMSYENRNKQYLSRGFFVNSAGSIDIVLFQHWDKDVYPHDVFLWKAKIDKGDAVTLTSYYYKAGSVKSGKSIYKFVEF
jgi:hypothetical protein